MSACLCPVCGGIWGAGPRQGFEGTSIYPHPIDGNRCPGSGLKLLESGKWSKPECAQQDVARREDIDWGTEDGSDQRADMASGCIENLVRQVGIARPGETVIVEAQFALTDEQHKRISIDLERAGRRGGTHFIVLDHGVRLARIEPKTPEEKL